MRRLARGAGKNERIGFDRRRIQRARSFACEGVAAASLISPLSVIIDLPFHQMKQGAGIRG